MKTNYILIDYENVQPKNLATMKGNLYKVIVFVGANQTRIPFDLAEALQKLGANAEYIKIGDTGPNALDFHIAYYVGKLAERDKEGYFHIISKDKGFDPLVKHLRAKKIHIHREKDLSEIPLLNISTGASKGDKIEAIVSNLAGRGQSRPRKVKTLSSTINSLFMKTLKESEIRQLINELKTKKYIVIENENVSYNTPIKQLQ